LQKENNNTEKLPPLTDKGTFFNRFDAKIASNKRGSPDDLWTQLKSIIEASVINN